MNLSGDEILFCFLFTTFSLITHVDNYVKVQQSNYTEGNNATLTKKTENNEIQHLKERMVTYCTTPNRDKGFCMPIMNCSKLVNQLSNKDASLFLRESKCGPKNENSSNPNVCCGKYSNFKNSGKNPFPKICGYQNVTIKGRILGGSKSELGEFPWLARLFHRDKAGTKMFGCSGFLISTKFVLTAAHCINSENIQILGPIYEVHLGEHNTKTKIDCNSKNTTCADKIQVIKVNTTIVHPSYNSSSKHHHHDIGLIYLKKSAKFSTYVTPICLVENFKFEPFEYWLSGWGSTETENLSTIKLKVSVPPFPHLNCSIEYRKLDIKIIEKQLCAGGKKNKDSCTGDSGGPLMLVVDGNHWFAAGVVSYGVGCGREGWPAIYTNITSYRNWIKNNMLKYYKTEKIEPKSIKHPTM